jgi:hypothetical protein
LEHVVRYHNRRELRSVADLLGYLSACGQMRQLAKLALGLKALRTEFAATPIRGIPLLPKGGGKAIFLPPRFAGAIEHLYKIAKEACERLYAVFQRQQRAGLQKRTRGPEYGAETAPAARRPCHKARHSGGH